MPQTTQLRNNPSSPPTVPTVDSRTKVLLMTNTLEVGGSERQFALLVESLSLDRFEVQPACLKRIGGLVARLGEIPEFPVGGGLVGLRALRSQLALIHSMRSQGIAVAHAFDFYTNLMLIPAARMAGVPVIGSHRQIGDLLSRAKFSAQYWAFRFCDRIVCNSRAAAQTLLSAGLPENKIEIIPNALGEEAFAECVPAIPRKPGVVRVGMIARMNNVVKNHPAFLRIAARLCEIYPAVEFALVGDGCCRPELERMAAALHIDRRVLFLGERHDIPAVLASLDVSVLLSSSESLSNVILESMAAGVPVVATAVGGTPELVTHGETGMLVPPNEEGKVLAELTNLVSNATLRGQLAVKSKHFARSNFHVDVITQRFEQLYLDLAKAR
ncbi:MAG TPA: glycosyltransferase [Candidatus Sulfotelmatobacter sp.]|nr:glycosyltransferase [Candidatus Sulfotelmatobacter sp.]